MKPVAFRSSTSPCRNRMVSGRLAFVVPTACRISMNRPSMSRIPGCEPTNSVTGSRTPAGRFQVLGKEHLGSLRAPHHLRVPQRAGKEQVVGGAALHTDAHTGAVHIGPGGQRRPIGHRVHALDQHVRGGEGHLVGPGGLDTEEADVGPSRQQRRQRIARGVEADEFDTEAEPGGDLAPDIDRHARSAPRKSPGQAPGCPG